MPYNNAEVQEYKNSGQWSRLLSLLINENSGEQFDVNDSSA